MGTLVWWGLHRYADTLPKLCLADEAVRLERVFQHLTVRNSQSVGKQHYAKKTDLSTKKALHPSPVSRGKERFDVNKATAKRLQTIAGIGPVLSTRIVKYRDKLGGFVSPDQYAEVYGLSESVLKKLKDQGYIHNTFRPTQIHLNSDSIKTMVAHPYLSYAEVLRIVRYREKHGLFRHMHAWKEARLLQPAQMEKMAPYLSL